MFPYDAHAPIPPDLLEPPPRNVERGGRPLIVVALAFAVPGVGSLLLSTSVYFSRFERAGLVVAAVILLGLLVWMWPRLKKQRARMLRMARHGVAVMGEVTGEVPSGVQYRFTVDGEELLGRSHFLAAPKGRPHIGDRLVVLYDPADPSDSIAACSLGDVRFSRGGRRRGGAASGTG